MIVELPACETGGPVAFERAADVRGTVVDADAADLEHAVGREEVGHVVPHLAVDVIAVGVLQIARLVLGVEGVDPLLEAGDRGLRFRRRTERWRDWRARLVFRLEVIRNQGQRVGVGFPPFLDRTAELRVVVQARDLPHAVVLHVLVLEGAAVPARVGAATQHVESVPARLGAVAIHGQIDERDLDEQAVDHAGRQARLAAAERGHVVLRDRRAPLDGVVAVDGLAIVGEERAEVGPQAVLGVVRIGVLQVLDGADRFSAFDVARQRID